MCKLLGNLSATTIDFLLLLIVLFGLLSNSYGLRKIYWGVTYERYHIFYCLSFVFLLVTFFYCIFMLYFRFKNTINTIWNTSMKCLVYFISSINVAGLILTLFSFTQTISGLNSPDVPIRSKKAKLFVRNQLGYIFTSMGFSMIFYALQFPFWYSTLKRIQLRTNGSLKTGSFIIASI